MRTRRGPQDYHNIKQLQSSLLSFPQIKTKKNIKTIKNNKDSEPSSRCHKRPRKSYSHGGTTAVDMFEHLPDDLVIFILSKLSSSASCSSDFFNILSTCKRLNGLGFHAQVLAKASQKIFAIKAEKWCLSAHKFFKLCADYGNVEAYYTLGMIRFYCLQNRASGASLMSKAAAKSHAQALYSLAIIQFNGSGKTKSDKDLHSGVAWCARAASLGHVDALRELGHCLLDGYGVRQNVIEGRRLLIQANARELASVLSSSSSKRVCVAWNSDSNSDSNSTYPSLSDFGCLAPRREMHVASRFLREWFTTKSEEMERVHGLRMCSHEGCGRPETRRHEFRRCSACWNVNYCSRTCQALDWKLRHKVECRTLNRRPAAIRENNILMMMDS